MTRRMPLRLLVAVLVAAVTCLLVLAGGSSMSAFTGSVRNSTNSVRTPAEIFGTCLAAEQGDGAARIYSLSDGITGGKNQGTTGGDATLWTNLAVNFGSDGGCLNDNPRSYFAVEPAPILTIAGRWVTGGSAATTILPGSAVTQEVWFRANEPAGLIMGFGNNSGTLAGIGSSTVKGLQVFLTSDGQLDFATSVDSGELIASAPDGDKGYADDKWHHVVAVYDNGTKKLYVDGTLRASGQGSTTKLSNVYWRLGYDSLSGWKYKSGSNYVDGGMQYAALYTKALTAAQVHAHYVAGTH